MSSAKEAGSNFETDFPDDIQWVAPLPRQELELGFVFLGGEDEMGGEFVAAFKRNSRSMVVCPRASLRVVILENCWDLVRLLVAEEKPSRNRARRLAIVTLWVLAAGLALTFATSLFLHYTKLALFLGAGCKEQIVSEIPSPDGRFKAVLFVRDCGATTRASTHVNVVRGSASGPGPASAQVLAGYEFPWQGPRHKIGAEWTGNRALNVYYASDVELTHLNNQVGNVHVRFELRPSTPEPK